MNSAQGGWGIQDRHDRVISWLSAVVVSLLVLYGLIYITSSGRPPQGPLGLRPTPPPSPTAEGPFPPTAPLPPATRKPRPTPAATPTQTRIAALPTSDVVRPAPTLPGLVPGLGIPEASPVPAATPTPEVEPPAATPWAPPPTLPPSPIPTQAPSPPPPPTPARPLPASPPPVAPPPSGAPPPGSDGPVYLRVGAPFGSGADALAFAMRYDLSAFRLEPVSARAGSPLAVEVGPFASESDALEASPGLRARLRDPAIPVLLRRAGDSASPTDPSPAAPTRVPVAATPPVPTREATTPAPAPSRPPRNPRRPRPTPAPVEPVEPPTPGTPSEIRVFGRNAAGQTDTPAVAEARRVLAEVHGVEARTGAGFSVQVAAFHEATNAANFRKHLAAKGYDAFVDVVEAGGTPWFRVMIGLFDGSAAARQEAERFLGQHPTGYQVFIRRR